MATNGPAAGALASYQMFIGGKWVDASSGETFESVNPYTGAAWATVPRASHADVDAAVRAARQAFDEGPWGRLTGTERARLMRRLAAVIEEGADDLARVEVRDNGKLIREMQGQIRSLPEYFHYFAGAADKIHGDTIPPDRSNFLIYSVPEPLGVVGAITPWNSPVLLMTWKLAPALAAGCTFVVKPAEQAPASTLEFAALVEEAGFPPGVFNVVQGIGEEAGAALVSSTGVRRISFTGSPETGRSIGLAAAANIVPFTAELGGKGPLIVFADSDLDAAAAKAAGQYDDAGQVCLAGTRLLVEESVRDAFLERFHAGVDAQVLGDPRDDRTTISPLIHPDHLARVEGFVERARANGDTIVRGGRQPDMGGLWYEPTLIEPRSNDSEVVQREVFGPVLTFQTFRDEREAIELANSTRYGLSAIVYTGTQERAERVGRAVRAGTVWVNTFLVRDLTAPFGGVGISGIGREGGDYALDFYSDLKTLQILDGSTA